MLPINSKLIPTVSRFLEDDWKNLFEWNSGLLNRNSFTPPINVIENADHTVLEVAIPGFKKEDIKVNLIDQTLQISTEFSEQKEDKNSAYILRQFGHRKFSQTINLQRPIAKEEKIMAEYKDGILKISVPMLDKGKNNSAKVIEIS